jgi:chromosome segregation ATPase
MNRFLQLLNLLGILALGLLCILQWQSSRRLNLQINDLEQTRLNQNDQLAQQTQSIRGLTADLEDFRARLSKADGALKDTQSQLTSARAAIANLSSQRDQLQANITALKDSLEKWTAAVAQRDEALKQAGDQLQKLANDRNDAISKFNDLAARYNNAVNELNTANADLQKLLADRNDAVAKFNALANKYNALLQPQTPSTTTRP